LRFSLGSRVMLRKAHAEDEDSSVTRESVSVLFVGPDGLKCSAERRILVTSLVLKAAILDAPVPIFDGDLKLYWQIYYLRRCGAGVVEDRLDRLWCGLGRQKVCLSEASKGSHDQERGNKQHPFHSPAKISRCLKSGNLFLYPLPRIFDRSFCKFPHLFEHNYEDFSHGIESSRSLLSCK